MRKLIVSMNLTLEAYHSGPGNDLSWHFDLWRPEMSQVFTRELCKTGTVLMGRVTFNAMARYWNERVLPERSSREDLAFALAFNRHQKIVYSNTMKETTWNNSHIVSGNLFNLVNELKSGSDEDSIMVYGSIQLVNALIRLNLVDVYHLWFHPVTIGRGNALFDEPALPSNLRLDSEVRFFNGVVLQRFNVKRNLKVAAT